VGSISSVSIDGARAEPQASRKARRSNGSSREKRVTSIAHVFHAKGAAMIDGFLTASGMLLVVVISWHASERWRFYD
jgi:hypothetical protein